MSERKRVLSGIQPTGSLHLGNYLGALRQWVDMQDEHENLFCVVDLHALTIPENVQPDALRAKSREVAAIYIAAGIDPARSAVFLQSQVRQHSELAWVLTCTTPLGWLERMTQFKTKRGQRDTVGTGLLTYPVLQAADILVYDADLVPVGEDQKQHIELARDIAERFNSLFGSTFVVPQVMIPPAGARIMGFDDPTAKMSKSLAATKPLHAVALLDSPKKIKKTIMKAVMDSNLEFEWDKAGPGVRNMISVHQALSGETRQSIADRFAGTGYGHLKKEVHGLVMGTLDPIQAEHARLMDDLGYLDGVLARSADKVGEIAEATMARVRSAVGIG